MGWWQCAWHRPKRLQQAEEQIQEHATNMAKLPGQFAEINEIADDKSQGPNGVTNWIEHEGPAKATEEAIDWIRKADPNKTISALARQPARARDHPVGYE